MARGAAQGTAEVSIRIEGEKLAEPQSLITALFDAMAIRLAEGRSTFTIATPAYTYRRFEVLPPNRPSRGAESG